MSQEEIFQKVNEILNAKKGFQPDTVSMDSTFEELDMDSLDSVELISDLEDHFNVSIPNQELLAIKTVREAVVSLEKLLKA